jgi:hypothetical protein
MTQLNLRDTSFRRKIAIVAAIFLLIGQTIAAAHFHRLSAQQEFSASANGIADSGCAVCLFHFHTPGISAAAPVLSAPTLLQHLFSFAVFSGPLSAFVRHRFGRAPPASL